MAFDEDICFMFAFLVHLIVYFAILALLVMITVLIFKYIGEWSEMNVVQEIIQRGHHENIPLMHQYNNNNALKFKGKILNYGTCEQDVGHGNCSPSSTSTNKVYNARICTICYDELRDCFFVPCGHCATCHLCALRYVSVDILFRTFSILIDII
ncbi:hypothetical protein vseg_015688 [Gypsophila vaccaria]